MTVITVGTHLPPATAEEPVASATKQEVTDNAQLSTAEGGMQAESYQKNT